MTFLGMLLPSQLGVDLNLQNSVSRSWVPCLSCFGNSAGIDVDLLKTMMKKKVGRGG